jgi:hypothetical protein
VPEESALIPDLPHFHAWNCAEVENQESRVATIETPEAVAALFDIEEQPGVAVHHDAVR